MSSLREAPEEMYDLYLQTASNIITYVDNSWQTKMLKELTDMVKTSYTLGDKLKQSCEILKRLTAPQNDSNEDQEALNCQETLDQFKNEIGGIDTDVSTSKKFLEFEQQVKVFLDDAALKNNVGKDDDELVLTQNVMNVIDPITKKRITDPVKNTACGHVYDRESVKALLKGNKHTRCPVVGCGNKNYIVLRNLQTDILTKKYLDRNPE